VKGNYLRITDTVQFSYLSQDWTKVQDDYEGAFKPQVPDQSHSSGMGQQTKGLMIDIAASHSGIITRNNGFYLPDKMNKGAESFVQDYGKPILLHHEDHKDNVGRVKRSQYIDTSHGLTSHFDGVFVKNKQGKQVATFNQEMIKDFCSGKLPFGTQIDVVRSVFKDAVLEDNYEGLGFIKITADITDQEAVKKLLDGRYLTGSVGATTNKAVCSVCRSDWTESGPCEHRPGGIYDDAKCFIIAGDLLYDEYSFVNVPADRHSRVLQLHYNGIQDNIEVASEFGRIYEVQLEFPQYDSVNKEENSMAKDAKAKDGDLQIQDSANPAPETENAEGDKDTQLQDSTPENSDAKPEDGKVKDNKKDENPAADDNAEGGEVQDSTESDQDFVVRVLDGEDELSVEDKQRAYQLLWDAGDGAEELKLSDEKLATLAKSQFCTKKCVFPVHDEAHLVAAHKLFGSIELSDETKEAVTTVLNRKAKARGVELTDAKASDVQDAHQHVRVMRQVLSVLEEDTYYTEEPVLDADEMKTLQSILKRLSSLVGKDALVKGLTTEKLASEETALLDEITKNEEEIGDLRDRLGAAQKEYHLLFEDMQTLQDSLVQEKATTRKVQESHLQTLLTLKDSKVEERNFTELSNTDIESKLKDASESVDMIKITDKLGDGMSRTPEGNVEDPNSVQDNSDQKSKVSVANLERIHATYMQLRMSRGETAAEAYLKDMKLKGFLPQDEN
jgi:hypothetical protein